MANLNLETFKKKLVESVQRVAEAETQAVTEGILVVQADIINRVFHKGQDSDNAPIGQYSTTPFYASIEGTKRKYGSQVQSGALKGKGKHSTKSKFANGKARRSQYMAGGYKEFRQVVGRKNDKVDLALTFSLLRSIQPLKGNVLGFNTQEMADRAGFNETRFKREIFSPTVEEEDKFVNNWADEIERVWFASFE